MNTFEQSWAVMPEALDYLQRLTFDPVAGLGAAPTTGATPDNRRLMRMLSVGRIDKRAKRTADGPDTPSRLPMEQVMVGLHSQHVPVAWLLVGMPTEVALYFGTWSPGHTSPGQLDEHLDIAVALVRGAYRAPEFERVSGDFAMPHGTTGGLVLGVPACQQPDPEDDVVAIDRLLRAMAGRTWSALVLAQPVDVRATASLRKAVVNEMRSSATAAAAAGAPSPLAKQYEKLLKANIESLEHAQASGAWRTAVYLLAAPPTVFELAAAWTSVYADGRPSRTEPVRVYWSDDVAPLAERWAMPDLYEPPAPGNFRLPFQSQTLLSSHELAAYVHLPREETPGFAVRASARFDTAPPVKAVVPSITLGGINSGGGAAYRAAVASLTKHALVAGVTGSGKTNTIFHLLTELDGVPFLVIEPAKREYRALLRHPKLSGSLNVYTAGVETVSPLRLNPFEVPPGSSVSQHLDLLRAAFTASFGMWTPLPQVLERTLHEVYVDAGWDIRSNSNRRLGDGEWDPAAFPTLTDLVAKVEEVVPRLSYQDNSTADIRAALTTRLDSLRRGGKGAMFDVGQSMSMDELLSGPTVIELEGIGNDDDKAFLMSLLLIRLVEHRRAAGPSGNLLHLLLIEEAHRLLTNTLQHASEETANPRGQAVETFTNLLSEIRSYGQGVVIADQIPVRLAPDAIKNTNLKIVHRTVAAEDRDTLAGSMAMDEHQSAYLTVLDRGVAAVFGDGDDAPVLVTVPPLKDGLTQQNVEDSDIAGSVGQPRAPGCSQACVDEPVACETARTLADDPTVQRVFARIVLSTTESPDALEVLWPDLDAIVRRACPPDLDPQVLSRCVASHTAMRHARHRGAQGSWQYTETTEYAERLADALETRACGSDTTASLGRFREVSLSLHRRSLDPFPSCGAVCPSSACVYRWSMADLVEGYAGTWKDADAADISSDGRTQTWGVCLDAAYEAMSFGDEDAYGEGSRVTLRSGGSRAALCFAQQSLAHDGRLLPPTSRRAFHLIMNESSPAAPHLDEVPVA